MTRNGFTTEERQLISAEFRTGVDIRCPSCAVPLDRRSVPPRQDVSYVRDRIWLVCPSCHRTVVIDRRGS